MIATLNNGIQMPLLGLGCWDMWDAGAQQTVETAIEIGYRLIDTAAMYRNEPEVGAGIAASGIPRAELFVTTKVGNTDQGYDSTLRAYDDSCKRLQLEYVDLYLVHWPVKDKRRETWRALEQLYAAGAVRAVGVCNYLPLFLKEMEEYAGVVPAVDQCEFTPYLFQRDLLDDCRARGILLQAWSPLVRGRRFDDPKLLAMAKKYGKTPAQILIRWGLDHGISTIPKSASAKRLRENFDVFDFSIAPADLAVMDAFNENFRVSGEDPM
ncbi:MAG TPA: aldo/keto reductase, partial [Saprospiraceae bacterium]|nr:aldo/keto reductase [Saprospiraceae bacterium]